MAIPATRATEAPEEQLFGHPRGIWTLFFTEMWERFSYYGMRGILILFMTAAATTGGLAYGDAKAAAIYGLYTGFVYLLALPGGWVADNLWGQRRAVFVGGCIIAAGHFTLALPMLGLPDQACFFTGVVLIAVGTGLLKPNVSTMVGELYPEGGARRDAGFSIFYSGINLGAFAGPLACGWLGEGVSWHWGFSAAGFGMVLGLIQYKLGERHLRNAGLPPAGDPSALRAKARNFYLGSAVVAGAVVLFVALATSGAITVSLQEVAGWVGYGILLLAVLFFAYLTLGTGWALGFLAVTAAAVAFLSGSEGREQALRYAVVGAMALFLLVELGFLLAAPARMSTEKRRLLVIFLLFLFSAVFWSGFEQAGSSLNLFADRLTDRVLLGWEMPTSWLQSVNPLFIIIFAPVFGVLWTTLARRNANPSIPFKFALGLLGLAAGFFVLSWGAAYATVENPVTPAWLVVTYFLHTCGELCLSPVGLSAMTKLAPANRVGQMMGVWFISIALGNLIAGLVAGKIESLPAQQLFWIVALITGGCGVVAVAVWPWIQRLTGGVR
jgi:POT family proton-dependent oligopeptide transporter